MKTSLLIVLSLFATLETQASGKNPKVMMEEVTGLEMTGAYQRASIIAASYANQIADAVGFDGVAKAIESSFTVRRREVTARSIEAKFGFSMLGGFLGSGSAKLNYDITRIVTLNPEELKNFEELNTRNFKKLQRDLRKYVAKNANNMVYAKLLAAKSLQLAIKVDRENLLDSYGYILRTAQRVSMISFLGTQNITTCVSTYHPKRVEQEELHLSGLFESLDFSMKDVQKAYTEEDCGVSTVTDSVVEFSLNSADLMLADQNLQIYGQLLGLKMFSETTAPSYPTWGSPYIQ